MLLYYYYEQFLYVQLGKLRISDKIKTLAQSGPSARYQVTRLLVYTGELRDNHCDGNLFANYDCGIDFLYQCVIHMF